MNEPSKLTHADGSIEYIQADCEVSYGVSQIGMRIIFDRYSKMLKAKNPAAAQHEMKLLSSTFHGMVMVTPDYLAEGDFNLLHGMLSNMIVASIEQRLADQRRDEMVRFGMASRP